jgi:uncharacterized protein YaaN involved in tellurite resistance
VADVVQTPTLTPQTVNAMAESVAKQAQGIIEAMEQGAQRRAELDEAMIQAKAVLDDTSKQISDMVIDHVIATATKPLELEVATSVTN